MTHRAKQFPKISVLVLVGLSMGLASCGSLGSVASKVSKLNPFKEKEVILPGERVAVLKPESSLVSSSTRATTPVSLPTITQNAGWTQPGGTASNNPGHLYYKAGLSPAWSTNVGYGSSSSGRLTVIPVVYGNHVFTMDIRGTVIATSLSSGGKVWSTSLKPATEGTKEGYGGGLAVDNGRLIAATGYGRVYALNPSNGKIIWKKNIGSPIRTSPTAAQGKVFVVSTEGQVFCLDAGSGTEVWSKIGSTGKARILDNVSPAVYGSTVVVPYSSGDMIAYDINTGETSLSESLSRSRNRSTLAAMSDPARPVIHNNVLYAVSHAGRMIATTLNSGDRLWNKNIRSMQMPWVSGNTVYVVDVNGQLIALDHKTGKVRWATKLSGARRWSGPVLASNTLWLVSKKGLLVGVDAQSGKLVKQKNIGYKSLLPPIIAGGRMVLLTDKAQLIALN